MNTIFFLINGAIVLSLIVFMTRLGKDYLIALIAVSTVLANIFVLKQMNIFGWEATGGNIMYAAIFYMTDILHECYGTKTARKAVLIGFISSLFFLTMSQLILLYQPNSYDIAHDSFVTLFTVTPRIILGSLVAYLVSQNLDIWVYKKIKSITGEKLLWVRNNISTIIAQFVDTIIFHSIAFYGVFPIEVLINITIFTFAIKIIIAAFDTPFLYIAKKVAYKKEITA